MGLFAPNNSAHATSRLFHAFTPTNKRPPCLPGRVPPRLEKGTMKTAMTSVKIERFLRADLVLYALLLYMKERQIRERGVVK